MKWILLVLAITALSSCAHCEIKVNTLHELPEKGNGQTFGVYGKIDLNRIEDRQYLTALVGGFEAYGWKYDEAIARPDYRLYVAWGVTDPTVTHGVMPLYGQTGGGTTYHTGTLNSFNSYGSASYSGTSYTPPTYGVVGAIPTTTITYGRYLFITAKDKAGRNVLESQVTSFGSTGHLSAVLPTMLEAYFQKFPGPSGKVRQYTRALKR